MKIRLEIKAALIVILLLSVISTSYGFYRKAENKSGYDNQLFKNKELKLLGNRFFTFSTVVRVNQIEVSRDKTEGVDESGIHGPEEARVFREAIDKAWPGARITWAFSWLALKDQRPNYVELKKLVVAYHKKYGDEITFIPGGYFANMYNSREQVNRDLHEGLKMVSEMVGGGYRPLSVVAGFLSAENLRYLAEEEGIHVCQGNIWSQYAVDNGDGEGSVSYPYYPSREHFCKPAQGKADMIDCVNLDGWTVDFVTARFSGDQHQKVYSRQGVGPIETLLFQGTEMGTKEMIGTTAAHFDQGFALNNFAWVTCIWELCLVEGRKVYGYNGRNGMDGMAIWFAEMRRRWPDAKCITQGEFGMLWREQFKNNDSINYRFVMRGTGVRGSEPEEEIRWFMNKDFRLAILRNWKENSPEKVIDFTRYDLTAREPDDPKPGESSRNWSLMNRLNQKGIRPEDQPVAISQLSAEEQAIIGKRYPELLNAVSLQTPVAMWDFETVVNRFAIEKSSNVKDTIEGNFELPEGVSGKGLRLDGFTTRVVRNGKDIKNPGSEFTIEAWVALGEYPLNWCPVITTESDEVKGYRLLVGPYGQVSFETAISEQWIACTSANETIPLRKWMHIAGVYSAQKEMTLYVNGEMLTTVAIKGSMTYPAKTSCILGMVAAPQRPVNTIRTWGTVPAYFGLDGIIDEIKVFDKALTAEQIKANYLKVEVKAPEIAVRRLPTIEKHPGRFGAFYTKLKYYPGWDNLWPVDQDPDIVVCFENNPSKLIFWRGIRYGPVWVSENEKWMADQSLETWGVGKNDIEGCFEHMQDRHCRFSHVRIIENSEARVVVHWRYALVSAHDNTWLPDPKTGWECWVDEYYYIYPDGSAIRKVSWNKGTTGNAIQYQESLPLTQPGQKADEVIENDYVYVADFNYNTRTVNVDPATKSSDWQGNYTVQQYNFKAANKPFICFEPGNDMWVRWIGGGYNHFPVNQARSDGRWAMTTDRPTHFMSSPCSDPVIHEDGNRLYWIGLYGMNDMTVNEVVRFGRSWAFAPELQLTGNGWNSKGYDKTQRCYQLEKNKPEAGSVELMLKGSKDSPVINPAFILKNWSSPGAKILVNGKAYSKSKVGVNHQLDGDNLIVYLSLNEEDPVKITIVP